MSHDAPRFSWGHINVNVRDLERSIDFYRKLGFELLIPGIPYLRLAADAAHEAIPDAAARALGLAEGTRGRACIMQLGDGFPKLDLTELVGLEQREPLANADLGVVRVCLASRNLESDYARLRDAGVEFLSEPVPGENGMATIATCTDPDGTLIELIELHLDKWPRPPRRS